MNSTVRNPPTTMAACTFRARMSKWQRHEDPVEGAFADQRDVIGIESMRRFDLDMRLNALDTVRPLYRELVERTREEPLCIAYDLFVDRKDEGHFIFIEEWPDQAALDAHCASEHFRRLVPQINAHQRQDCRVMLMNSFDSGVPAAR